MKLNSIIMSFRLNLFNLFKNKYPVHLSIITSVSIGTYLLYNNYKEQIESRLNLKNLNLNNVQPIQGIEKEKLIIIRSWFFSSLVRCMNKLFYSCSMSPS